MASVTDNPALLNAGLQIDPDLSAGNPQFAISHLKNRRIDNLSAFSDFVTAANNELRTHSVHQVATDGPYNASTGVFSADDMVVTTDD